MNILGFAASSSRHSINKKLVSYALTMLPPEKTKFLDLCNFTLPLYSIDLEEKSGIPEPAKIFLEEIQKSDSIIISFAEHNGSYTAA